MDLYDAHRLGRTLLDRHGLTQWRLVFDRAKTRAGVCRTARREIGLSAVLTRLHSEAEVRETLLHEIAHALVGAEHGHDEVWRSTALAIGGSATRCVPADAPRAPAPWQGVCPAGHSVTRHRAPERVTSCRTCAPRFDLRHLHTWTWHGREVPMPAGYVHELARLTAVGEGHADAVLTGRARGGGPGWPIEVGPGDPVAEGRLAPGAIVVLGGSGRYAGLAGRVVKRGRTRYHVRTDVGVVTAPFALVRLP